MPLVTATRGSAKRGAPIALVCTASVVGLTLLGGCASPRADLSFISQPGASLPRQIDSYAFPRSYLELKTGDAGDVTISSRNQPYERFRVALSRKIQTGVRTNIGLVKVENSDLLKEVGVETKDERVALIGNIGKLVTGLVPFAGLTDANTCPTASNVEPTDPVAIPTSIDALGLMIQCQVAATANDPTDITGWRQIGPMRIWFGSLPPDAAPVFDSDQSPTSLSDPKYSRGIVYAACREMRLMFSVDRKTGNKIEQQKILRSIYISDPRYFRYVAMPYKGKIKIHDTCGVSIETDSSAAPSSEAAIAQALLEQAKAVREALEKDDDKN